VSNRRSTLGQLVEITGNIYYENKVLIMFSNIYLGKKVLVTGHTGFKGSWLTCWLLKLGAEVVGISKDVPTNPAMFGDLQLESMVKHHVCDIRDLNRLSDIINRERPDVIFHLAAQAIVSTSYDEPAETITTNALGTMNIMEVLRKVSWPCSAVLITSDKSYDNVEWVWGYKETDSVGGKDVYSGSKGAAELIIKSYYHSFFHNKNHCVNMAVGRAGNVIGGGDWARDRIIVDTVKAWSKKQSVEIRCPDATRPWQHVLEPISGYLALGEELLITGQVNGEAFNFGPRAEQNRTVTELLTTLSDNWTTDILDTPFTVTDNIPFKEAGLLKLNCDKALFCLKWDATLNYFQTVKMTAEWYSAYFAKDKNMFDVTKNQIEEYQAIALERKSSWAC
jgi:CDP-glucose 4,6-dehydratase